VKAAFWVNGWWTGKFEQAKRIAAQFAGTKGYERISFSETGEVSELTHCASLHGDRWALVEQYA